MEVGCRCACACLWEKNTVVGSGRKDDKLVLLEIKAAAGREWSKERRVQGAAASQGGRSAVAGLWVPRERNSRQNTNGRHGLGSSR